jgi:RimJ/RimL family protein N-acetyltransferase
VGWPGCELGLLELISLIRPANLRSIRLAERLGAHNSGAIDFLGSSALLFRHAAA